MRKYFYILLLLGGFISAQTLYSTLDKKTVALGEPNVYKIRIDNLAGKDVVSAPKNELLPFHFEEIKDEISKQQHSYERTIEFAVFQEGKFTIPAFELKVGGEVYRTIPYEVEVINTAKKGDQINDIMQNKNVKLDVQDYWELYKWYLLGFLILLALIFIIYQIVKYGRKRRSAPVMLTNQALKELEALKKKKYIENNDSRGFYVELIDITRRFITKQYGIPADVLLTEDLVAYLKQNHTISEENDAVIEHVFQRGDMVKFAKIVPEQAAMQQDFENIKALVKRSSKDLELENLRKDV